MGGQTSPIFKIALNVFLRILRIDFFYFPTRKYFTINLNFSTSSNDLESLFGLLLVFFIWLREKIVVPPCPGQFSDNI